MNDRVLVQVEDRFGVSRDDVWQYVWAGPPGMTEDEVTALMDKGYAAVVEADPEDWDWSEVYERWTADGLTELYTVEWGPPKVEAASVQEDRPA